LCTRFREARTVYRALEGGYLNKEDQAKKIKMNYIAATNKRDLYCELAFRMRNENDGVLFLRWLFTQIVKSPKSSGWWAIKEPTLPAIRYLQEYRTKVAGKPIMEVLLDRTVDSKTKVGPF
jgi:hypothetical protein